MADHTMQLRHVIQAMDSQVVYERMEFNGANFGSLPRIVGGNFTCLDDYPIFDEDYRPILNGKIIDKFYLQEHGHESIGIFIHRLRVKMNEIMADYNPLYRTITFDEAMMTTDIRTTSTTENETSAESTGESVTTTKNKSGSRTVNLSFPQTALAANADYAESGVDTTGNNEAEANGNETGAQTSRGTGVGETRTFGRSGSASEAIMAYRAQIVNVDRLIFGELTPLFMGVWGTGDTFMAPKPIGY